MAALILPLCSGVVCGSDTDSAPPEEREPTSRPTLGRLWKSVKERGSASADTLQRAVKEARPLGEAALQQAGEWKEQAEDMVSEKVEPWRQYLISTPNEDEPEDAEEESTPPEARVAALPDRFSLRPIYEELGLGIKNQGRRGSCTIFGTLGVIEFHYALRGQSVRLSEQFAGWAAADAQGSKSKLEGYSSQQLIRGIKKHGICTEELMPYDARRMGRPSKEALADAETRRSISETIFQRYRENRRRDGFTEQTLRAICWSLYEKHPVTAAVAWPNRVEYDPEGNIIWKSRSAPPSGHMVVFVGYEIDESLPGGGRMEIRNSWGEDWGVDGHAYIDFEYLTKFGKEAFAIKAF